MRKTIFKIFILCLTTHAAFTSSASAACLKFEITLGDQANPPTSCDGAVAGENQPTFTPSGQFSPTPTLDKSGKVSIGYIWAPGKNQFGNGYYSWNTDSSSQSCTRENSIFITASGSGPTGVRVTTNEEAWNKCNKTECYLHICGTSSNTSYTSTAYKFNIVDPTVPPGPTPKTLALSPAQGKYPVGPAGLALKALIKDQNGNPLEGATINFYRYSKEIGENKGNFTKDKLDNAGEITLLPFPYSDKEAIYYICIKSESNPAVFYPDGCSQDSSNLDKMAKYEFIPIGAKATPAPLEEPTEWTNDTKYDKITIESLPAEIQNPFKLLRKYRIYSTEQTFNNVTTKCPSGFTSEFTNNQIFNIPENNQAGDGGATKYIYTCVQSNDDKDKAIAAGLNLFLYKVDHSKPKYGTFTLDGTTQGYFNAGSPNASPNTPFGINANITDTYSGIDAILVKWFSPNDPRTIQEKELATKNESSWSLNFDDQNTELNAFNFSGKLSPTTQEGELKLGVYTIDKAGNGQFAIYPQNGTIKIDTKSPSICFSATPTNGTQQLVPDNCSDSKPDFKTFNQPIKLTMRIQDDGSGPIGRVTQINKPDLKCFFELMNGERIVQKIDCKDAANNPNSSEIILPSGQYRYSIQAKDIAGNVKQIVNEFITVRSDLSPINFTGKIISSVSTEYTWDRPTGAETATRVVAYRLTQVIKDAEQEIATITKDLSSSSFQYRLDKLTPTSNVTVCLASCIDKIDCSVTSPATPDRCIPLKLPENRIEPKKVIARGKEIEGDNIYFDVDATDTPLFKIEFDNELDATDIANNPHVSLTEIGDFSTERCVDSAAVVENGNQLAVSPISVSASRCFGKVRPNSSYKITLRPGVKSTSGAISTKSLTYYFTTRSDTASGRVNSPKDTPSARSNVSWPENRRTDVVVVIRPKDDVNRAVVGQANGSLASSLGNTLSCRSTLCTYNFVEVILYKKTGTTYTEINEVINPPYTLEMRILRSAAGALAVDETIFNYGIYKVVAGSSRNTGTLEKLPSSRNLGSTVLAEITTSGIYALAGAPPTSLGNAHPWPVPYKPSAGHTKIQFKNLALDTSIKVFTITGELVWQDNNTNSGAPTIDWNVKNQDGEPVASGVYVYLLKNPYSEKKGKLMIIK